MLNPGSFSVCGAETLMVQMASTFVESRGLDTSFACVLVSYRSLKC